MRSRGILVLGALGAVLVIVSGGSYILARNAAGTEWPTAVGFAALAAVVTLAAETGYIWSRHFRSLAVKASGQFRIAPMPPLRIYNLFELGIVDLNQDDRLDLFTANHDCAQSYLIAQQDGSYQDVQTRYGLDQDISFPGIEDLLPDHPAAAPGIYIYFRGTSLALQDRRKAGAPPVTGTIMIVGHVAIRKEVGGTVQVRLPPPGQPGVGISSVQFHLASGASIELFVELLGTPIRFSVDDTVPLESLHVGRGNCHPAGHQFAVLRRDRHGHAWADIDGDGRLDVYIGRGGYRGQLDAVRQLAGPDFDLDIEDEMLVNAGPRFNDCTGCLGFSKRNCRTRGAAWVDVNNSGALALYVTCLTTPNQLYVRDASGVFVDAAEQAGLDISGSFSFVWVDLDGDGRMDLVIDERDAIRAYYNEGNLHFRRVTVAVKPRPHEMKLSVADFNQSGYPSIVGAAPSGLMLLVNRGGELRPEDPALRGLPADGHSAHWVDYDNDGLVDLFVVPHGLYRQQEDGQFRLVSDIRMARPDQAIQSLVQWFDADNSGFRDAIIAVRQPVSSYVRRLIDAWQSLRSFWARPEALPRLGEHTGTEGRGYEYYVPTINANWSAWLVKNRGNGNNWLEIVLDGAPGNPQAIGATVAIETGSRRQTQGVGWADGAVYSQGHYRLYFGVGRATEIDRIEVKWPLGRKQELTAVSVNRLLHISEA